MKPEDVDGALDRMRGYAVRHAVRMLPPDLVDDAVQLAMIDAWTATTYLVEKQDEGSPYPLLTRSIRRRLAFVARGHYEAVPTVSLDAVYDELEDFDPDESQETWRVRPDAQDEYPSFSERMGGAIDSLPPRQREVVVELLAEGRSKKAAASVMGVTDTAVRQLAHKAVPALRSAYLDAA